MSLSPAPIFREPPRTRRRQHRLAEAFEDCRDAGEAFSRVPTPLQQLYKPCSDPALFSVRGNMNDQVAEFFIADALNRRAVLPVIGENFRSQCTQRKSQPFVKVAVGRVERF